MEEEQVTVGRFSNSKVLGGKGADRVSLGGGSIDRLACKGSEGRSKSLCKAFLLCGVSEKGGRGKKKNGSEPGVDGRKGNKDTIRKGKQVIRSQLPGPQSASPRHEEAGPSGIKNQLVKDNGMVGWTSKSERKGSKVINEGVKRQRKGLGCVGPVSKMKLQIKKRVLGPYRPCCSSATRVKDGKKKERSNKARKGVYGVSSKNKGHQGLLDGSVAGKPPCYESFKKGLGPTSNGQYVVPCDISYMAETQQNEMACLLNVGDAQLEKRALVSNNVSIGSSPTKTLSKTPFLSSLPIPSAVVDQEEVFRRDGHLCRGGSSLSESSDGLESGAQPRSRRLARSSISALSGKSVSDNDIRRCNLKILSENDGNTAEKI